jgi:predicted helicase
MIERGDHRYDLMRHMFKSNLALITVRRIEGGGEFTHFFATSRISVLHSTSAKEGNFVFPLYLYPNGKMPEADLFAHDNGRRPNLSAEFIRDFCERLNVKFVPDGLGRPGKREVGPELIFHYAYAVFHSAIYRERYAEFLRADFPRLPLTSDFELFRTLASFGAMLVNLHAGNEGDGRGPGFPIPGENQVADVRYQPPQGSKPGRVWINDRQYFEGVPEAVWKFPVGGYLPAQRWLKDRKKRKLSFEDIRSYARIVFALSETRKLMAQIDETVEVHGGWPLK